MIEEDLKEFQKFSKNCEDLYQIIENTIGGKFTKSTVATVLTTIIAQLCSEEADPFQCAEEIRDQILYHVKIFVKSNSSEPFEKESVRKTVKDF